MVTASKNTTPEEPAPEEPKAETVDVTNDPAGAEVQGVQGTGTPDDPYKIPASELVGSDGRPSVTIPRPDPGVQIVYDDVPDPDTNK